MNGFRTRVGILGGTLDPIHNGHLMVAEEARSFLNLNEVIFMPASLPWMKTERLLTLPRHRHRMAQLATKGYPYFHVSKLEINRGGPTYTIDTLRAIRASDSIESDIFFIVGADAFGKFHLWKAPRQILRLCTLVVAPRFQTNDVPSEGYGHIDIDLRQEIIKLGKPLVNISSTEIRQRVAGGKTIRGYVPEQVEQYIHRNGLYKGERKQ